MLKNEIIEVVKSFVENCGDNDEIKALKSELLGILKLTKGEGRKEELKKILEEGERLSILELGEKMKVSSKNVSSLLCYLRKDGVKICVDSEGKRFIE